MFVIRTKYRKQGAGVVGKAFDTKREAEMLLEMRGWKPDRFGNTGPNGEPEWEKPGPTRMMGQMPFCVSEYVYISEE